MQWQDEHFRLTMDAASGMVKCQTLNGGVPIDHLHKILHSLTLDYNKSLPRPAPSAECNS